MNFVGIITAIISAIASLKNKSRIKTYEFIEENNFDT